MIRIVGGQARGRRLAVPGRDTRPTSERAREALFNSVAGPGGLVDLDGAHVLDLFAGSGAVGFEALSRGAGVAVLVDSSRVAVDVLHANARTLALPGARVVRSPADRFLAGEPTSGPFDLVFADPPYVLPDGELAALLTALADPRWLTDAALVVVERSVRSPAPSWPDGLAQVRQRRYGEGALWYGRWR